MVNDEKTSKINRREFLENTFKYTASAAAALTLGRFSPMFPKAGGGYPDLVAVRNGEPDVMFDAGMKALGGISRFVKKNQTVVIKPNIGWAMKPEDGANTNPKLVSQVIKHCLDAGAKKVYVFDHSCDTEKYCYNYSGIEKAAKDSGAVVVSGSDHGMCSTSSPFGTAATAGASKSGAR